MKRHFSSIRSICCALVCVVFVNNLHAQINFRSEYIRTHREDSANSKKYKYKSVVLGDMLDTNKISKVGVIVKATGKLLTGYTINPGLVFVCDSNFSHQTVCIPNTNSDTIKSTLFVKYIWSKLPVGKTYYIVIDDVYIRPHPNPKGADIIRAPDLVIKVKKKR